MTSLLPGQTVSHFRILGKLGQGGMGVVYQARDEALGRPVALKLLAPALLGQERYRLRLLREARTAAAVNHPNIAAIYEIGDAAETVFIAMEFVGGRTLRSLLAEGPLPVPEAIRIASQIAEGLAAAHDARVIHRDLKPENVLVGASGTVKILDFGLAKWMSEPSEEMPAPLPPPPDAGSARLTREGAIVGTPAYMAPEQARRRPLDGRADLFSLGVILYEALAGRAPFEGPTPTDILKAVLSQEPAPLAERNPEVSPSLQRIVEKLLAKKPAERYHSARDLLVELRHAAEARRPRRGPSLGVVPFTDMSAERDQEYFCEGMAEELINALTQVPGLHVVSRSAAFQFQGQGQDVRRVGAALGVAYVLDGSVRKSANKLRIAVQLVQVADESPVWSGTYDREMEDVFAIQDEIAHTVVSALRVKLVGADGASLVRRSTDSLEAYKFYLKGRHYGNRRYESGLQRGLECFRKAIEEDPSYALAYAGLADSYSLMAQYSLLPTMEAYPAAKAAAEQALALDPTLAEAHVARALVHFWFQWDFGAAERGFRRAVELNPTHAPAYAWYASLLGCVGRLPEAADEARKGQELDPLSPLMNGVAAVTQYLNRAYDQAIRECQKALEFDPHFAAALYVRGLALCQKGMFVEGIAELRKTVTLSERHGFFLALLGMALGMAGRAEEAVKVLEELQERAKHEYVTPLAPGWVYLGLGRSDEAFDYLDRALEERSIFLIFLKTDPRYDRLRADPRFAALMRRIGLP